MTGVLLVALGAALGAPLRYAVDRAVQRRQRSAFPWGTFAVNVTGSFLLGLLTAVSTLDPRWVTAAGVGFCGAFTTYSAFGHETAALVEERHRLFAVANVIATVSAGLAAAIGGYALGLQID